MAINDVDIVTAGSLLNGFNHFYIPSYQRGYRWQRKQIEELLGDLYSFRMQYEKGNRSMGNFYCLQPVIVKEITDSTLRNDILGEKANDPAHKLWELVDGQQRMTSLFIILAYLLRQKGLDEAAFEKRYRGKMYTMYYESRPETSQVLDSIFRGTECGVDNIDAAHIRNAYRFIDEWFEKKGPEISARYVGGDGSAPEEMWDKLISQISKTSEDGPVKVIWYQLGSGDDVDPVQEFTRINNGKIPLTDTELVKALFLQKKNFSAGEKVLQQARLSLQWEQMENMLQRNDFWCFISDKDTSYEDRMGELLKLVYLKYSNANPREIESGDIFRFYYNRLDGLDQQLLQSQVFLLWDDIMAVFRTLLDWFDSPEVYNYVGYLVHSGMQLPQLYAKMEHLHSEKPHCKVEDFIMLLEEQIKSVLPKNCIAKDDDGKWRITVEYPNRPDLRKILLLLNVDQLSQQLVNIRLGHNDTDDELHTDANVFKFPFDLYMSQKWDIEHIDSATTNTLTDKDAQRIWVENAIRDAHIEETEVIRNKMENGEWADLIGIIQQHEEEQQENKNFIGNLTLLDQKTNREYKNDLYCQKRRKIIEKIRNGRFILTCTQYVFMKFFDDDDVTGSRLKWTGHDKEKYHSFILEQLGRFLLPEEDING